MRLIQVADVPAEILAMGDASGPVKLLHKERLDQWEMPLGDFIARFTKSIFSRSRQRTLRNRLELFISGPRNNGGLNSDCDEATVLWIIDQLAMEDVTV